MAADGPLDDRKSAILRAVVQQYIETAQPVGSTTVAARPDVAVSSATVRNDMTVLERDGYLAQPHTSAGRLPTHQGLRFFVDAHAGAGVTGGAARLALDAGIGLDFAPVVDVATEPSNPVIGDRILFAKWAGYQATGPGDGQLYRVVNDSDIFMQITKES